MKPRIAQAIIGTRILAESRNMFDPGVLGQFLQLPEARVVAVQSA